MRGNTYLEDIVEHLVSRVQPPLEMGSGSGERFRSDRVGKVYDTWYRAPGDNTAAARQKCIYDFLGDGDDHTAPSARLDAQEVARALNLKVSQSARAFHE